jgi:hypothetical protein
LETQLAGKKEEGLRPRTGQLGWGFHDMSTIHVHLLPDSMVGNELMVFVTRCFALAKCDFTTRASSPRRGVGRSRDTAVRQRHRKRNLAVCQQTLRRTRSYESAL